MESQPQNPEFRNNPENFHPCIQKGLYVYLTAKEMHIFNIHLIPETLIKFYPK